MAWKTLGEPTVHRQRDRWAVRVDGIDTETGDRRPRQLGTYPTQRAALAAARTAILDDWSPERRTVSWLVRRYVASRTDLAVSTQEQYAWTIPHIEAGLGAVRLDRLDRDDIRAWMADMAAAGRLSRRSIQVCRNVLRAALADAVDEGLLRRSPANRVPMPRVVVKQPRAKTMAWTDDEVRRFLVAAVGHRLEAAFRIAVLYGLRRSELLALRWNDVDLAANTLRIDEGLVAVRLGVEWSNGKNTRSRRTIPLDPESMTSLARRRREQAEERLEAGSRWTGQDLIFTNQDWGPLLPRSFDRTLERLLKRAELPMLTSHRLRHTAASHMVANAHDLGELQAVSEILGHSTDILLRVYAHALPSTLRAISDRIGERAG
jgi:integrase